jgi:hypothetical protein
MAEKISSAEAEALRDPKPSSRDAGGLPPEDGLEILGSEPEALMTSIGPVSIAPMRMGQVKRFIKVADRIVPKLQAQLEKDDGTLDIAGIYTGNEQEFMEAVEVACGLTPEQQDEMLPDEYLRVVTKIIVVNLDFFARTLPTVYGGAKLSLRLAMVKLAKAATGGRSQSNG